MKQIPETAVFFGNPKGFDPEFLYVECGKCGAPVIWEKGRATRLLEKAGIDPLELDASCLLLTDGCPLCEQNNEYHVRIFRVGDDGLPPRHGNA